MLTFRNAREEETEEICRILTDAYMDYDFFSLYEENLKKRWNFIYEIQMLGMRANMKRGQFFVGEDDGQIVLALACQEPQKKQAGLAEYLLSGAVKAMMKCGFAKMLSWNAMDEHCEKPIRVMMQKEKNVYYLHNLAVRKSAQKKGYGSRAIQEFLIPRIKNSGGGSLTLITNSQENADFYGKNGFTCFNFSQVMCKKTPVGNWCLKMEIPSC